MGGTPKTAMNLVAFPAKTKQMGNELWRLVFVNNGVKLTIESSDVPEDLKDYEDNGIRILLILVGPNNLIEFYGKTSQK
jgi:hypothetical protein